MVLKIIDLNTTQLTLEEVLAQIDENTEVLLTRGDAPIARFTSAVPPATSKQRSLGLHEGEGWMSDDFTDELPDSFWQGEDE
jgi:hypothetical protein